MNDGTVSGKFKATAQKVQDLLGNTGGLPLKTKFHDWLNDELDAWEGRAQSLGTSIIKKYQDKNKALAAPICANVDATTTSVRNRRLPMSCIRIDRRFGLIVGCRIWKQLPYVEYRLVFKVLFSCTLLMK